TLRNKGSTPDRLVGGSVAVASRFEGHRLGMGQGGAKMRPGEGGLGIQPGGTGERKPGSFPLLLPAVEPPLANVGEGKGTLEFEKAGKVDIECAVEALGATAPTAGEHHH